MALLNMLFLFIFIAALAVSGARMYGALITRGKINDSRKGMENQVRMITAWAAREGRLPRGDEYATLFGGTPPLDAWGRQIAYVYDDSLTVSSPGALCGRTSTFLQDSGACLAFALISGGDDATIETAVNGQVVTPPTKGVSGATAQNLTNYRSDLYRAVPLEELKSKIGCYGATGGKLALLNNELPRGCAGAPYAASLFASGGIPFNSNEYKWCVAGLPITGSSLIATGGTESIPACPAFSAGTYASIQLTGNGPDAGTTSQLTFGVQDHQIPTANTLERIYLLNFMTGGACGGGNQGINTGDPVSNRKLNVVTTTSSSVPGSWSVTGDGLIQFGDYATAASPTPVENSAGCIWYPDNFPLLGRSVRASWNFCFAKPEISGDSTAYGNGYTLALMQGSNPTSYCGTGTTFDSVTNPHLDCSGGFGEFLAYCGLPGRSIAAEFDIYPDGSRGDPSGNYNHLAVVKSQSLGFFGGAYGDNSHGYGDNPSCNDGAHANSGCSYGSWKGVTWLEDGCNATKDNHLARVEITRCNSDCSSCGSAGCSGFTTSDSSTLIKIWIDKGNKDISGNDTVTPPDINYCTPLDAAMNQFKVGFTQATGPSHQLGYISNFILDSFGSCPRPAISPASLPAGKVGVDYTAQMTATGGTAPYDWSWSSSNIMQNGLVLPATTLPAGLTMSSSGLITGTPLALGTFNTVLVSAKDRCTTDGCANTVSKSYSMVIGRRCPGTVSGITGYLVTPIPDQGCVNVDNSGSPVAGTITGDGKIGVINSAGAVAATVTGSGTIDIINHGGAIATTVTGSGIIDIINYGTTVVATLTGPDTGTLRMLNYGAVTATMTGPGTETVGIVNHGSAVNIAVTGPGTGTIDITNNTGVSTATVTGPGAGTVVIINNGGAVTTTITGPGDETIKVNNNGAAVDVTVTGPGNGAIIINNNCIGAVTVTKTGGGNITVNATGSAAITLVYADGLDHIYP